MKLKRLLQAFLELGIIVGPLPSQLANGTVGDAVEVMADLNFIAAQVNANAQPLSTSSTLVPQYVAAVGGTPNAITLTPTVPISSYSPGQSYMFLPIAPNTGATTIATSSLALRNLLYADGTAMSGGELLTGQPYFIQDNGANYVLINSAQATGIVPWTPTITFGGASVGMAYSAIQTGVSCKIGRICFIAFAVQLTNKGVSVGVAAVNGLPYTVNAAWLGQNAGGVVAANLGFAAGYNMFSYNLGTKTMALVNITNLGALAGFTDASFTNTTLIGGSMFYAV